MKSAALASPSPFLAIGLDVGGTKIAAGLVEFPEARILGRHVVPTPHQEGGKAVLAACRELAQTLAMEAGSNRRPLGAVGIGICEIVDPAGAVRSSNCISWEGVDVARELAAIAPTVVEADVRAAALAEARFGAGRAFENFVYVTIGTGISMSLVLAGRPYTGVRGAAGTFASSPLPVATPTSGPPPSIEELASGPGLVARFRARGRNESTAEELLALAARGDPTALDIVQSGARALGAGVAGLVNTLDPDAVILGGGLGLAGGIYLDTLIRATREHIWWPGHRGLPIRTAALGADAGIIGAATAAWLRQPALRSP